jgi:hypothetical protein
VSRRSAKPRPSVPGSKVIRIVCTDRGQHPEVLFEKVDVWPDESIPEGWFVEPPEPLGGEYTPPHGVRDDITQLHEHDTAGPLWEPITYPPFKCSRCGREVPFKRETLMRACADLAASGASRRLDVSYVG